MENEIEKKEIITKGIKITTEVRDQFERLATAANAKDGEFLALVLKQYEQRSLASSAPGREIELANVDMLLNKLRDAFAGSVALCNDTEARIRNELKKEISAMQEAISAQKEKINNLMNENETLKVSAEAAEKKYSEQCSTISELKNDLVAAQKEVSDEKVTIETLQSALSTVTNENTKLNVESDQIQTLKKSIVDANAKIVALEQEIENIKKQNEIDVATARLDERAAAQEQREKMVLDFMKEIKKLKTELAVAVAKTQKTKTTKQKKIANPVKSKKQD